VKFLISSILTQTHARSFSSSCKEYRAKLALLIRLRWIALLGQAGSGFLGYYLGYLPREFLALYVIVLIGMGLWNIVSHVAFYLRKSVITHHDLTVQLFADLTGLTLLLSMTGGIYNPLCSLLMLHSVFAALLLRRRSLYLILGLTCISLAFLQWLPEISPSRVTGEITRSAVFASYSFAAVIITGLTSWLVQTLNMLQAGFKQLQERQGRMDRLKIAGAMAAGFSHEFTTPLYAARLRTERVLKKGPESTREDASQALDALNDCERILKSLTQNGMKADQLTLETKDLASGVSAWVAEFKKQQPHFRIQLRINTPPSLTIEAPWEPLRRSFLDLLENAAEASSTQSVRINLCNKGPDACVEIENPGEKISELVLKKWGEPFVTTKSHGTGLGIYNALTLLRAMGGNLETTNHSSGITLMTMKVPCSNG
jgi:two-component system sensor histidine kinase RegB